MNKKAIKMISIMLIAIILIATSTQVFALEPIGIEPTQPQDTSSLTTFAGKIMGALQAIGVTISVIILMVIGIKYMMGSAEEKAEYKKTMVPYIVGAAILFTASTLAQAVYKFFS